MRQHSSLWCRTVSAVSLLALCFSLMTPAMWTMRCVGTDRSRVQWGQAKECQAPVKATDGPVVRTHCCTFQGVKSNVEHFTWDAATPHAVLPVFFCELRSVEPLAGSFAAEVFHYAHGPPLACPSRSLLATGQLRV
jgi:hypothetical protein